MGWTAIARSGEVFSEDKHGRPVAEGKKGNLAAIIQEDFGHSVLVDLINGIIAIDFDHFTVENGTLSVDTPKMHFYICTDTIRAGELSHLTSQLDPVMDDEIQRIDEATQQPVFTRTDTVTPLIWRPIWFTRWINFIPTKVIGAQTTLPKVYGGKNVKKMVMLFADGQIGIA